MGRTKKETKSGDRFGRWTMFKELTPRKKPRGTVRVFLCKCECGAEREVILTSLISGRSTSCGCLHKEVMSEVTRNRNLKHGLSDTAEYTVWKHMMDRCYNPKSSEWHNYGARGISVCDEWRNNFEIFLEDVGKRPSSGHSIDRIDNNGNYEPDNVRWATTTEQCENTRRNRFVTYNEKTLTVYGWSRELNIHPATLTSRLNNPKLSIEEALTLPVGYRSKR